MTEPHGPEDGFDLDELAGYLEELEVGVDAHVTEPRLAGLRAQALTTIDPAPELPAHPYAQTPESWPGRPWPLPTLPYPVPPTPPLPIPLPLPSPLPMPPLPTEPVPPPLSAAPTWHEPEDGGHDTGPRGASKRQR